MNDGSGRKGGQSAYNEHNMSSSRSAGAQFRQVLREEHPLQLVGAINAYAARLAEAVGFRALYLSGGGVADELPGASGPRHQHAGGCAHRHHGASPMPARAPLLVDADTGWGGAFNIARTVRAFIKAGAAGMHIEDQVQSKRCGHRPGKEIVSQQEWSIGSSPLWMRAPTTSFVIMARTDALASEGLDAAIERMQACVEAGADMVFPEAVTDLRMYRTLQARGARCRSWRTSPSSARRRCTRATSWAQPAWTSCCTAARPIAR